MADQKPLFKAPYDIKDVSALFAIVAFVLIIAAIVGNNLFGLFQQNVNFGWSFLSEDWLYGLPKIEFRFESRSTLYKVRMDGWLTHYELNIEGKNI